MMLRRFFYTFIAALIAIAPAAARADLWINAAHERVLFMVGCDVNVNVAGAVIACRNYPKGHLPAWPFRKVRLVRLGGNSGCQVEYRPSVEQWNRWDAVTTGYGGARCRQEWRNENTLDVFIN